MSVVFHLKRMWEGKDIWQEIKSGRKTSEWRDFSKYWLQRLCWKLRAKEGKFGPINLFINGDQPQDLTFFLKVHRASFVQGYPKHNVPRLEADITELIHHPETCQLEIKFTNVRETRMH